jgi:hypothetical protein
MTTQFTREAKIDRLRYTRLLWPRKAYRHRGFIYVRYPVDRYEFYKAGLAVLRLPGKLWSPAFMAAYEIAFTCQKPFRPAHNDRSLAIWISICSNLLLLTAEFRQLNAETRARYQYLIENFCSQVAGCPIRLKTHRKTAMFIYRHRSRTEVQRRIRTLRRLVADAGALSSQDDLRPNTIDLKEWTKQQRATKATARKARIAARILRRASQVTRCDAKRRAIERMRLRARLLGCRPWRVPSQSRQPIKLGRFRTAATILQRPNSEVGGSGV